MDYIQLLLPFLLAGFIASAVARFTGIALSFLLVPILLYWGATPIEIASFMLTFVLYHTFTTETQDIRLNLKDLTFFPGWKLIIPVIIAFALSFLYPLFGIGLFILCFILELGAALYKRLPQQDRPALKFVIVYGITAAIDVCIGLYLAFNMTPAHNFYFVGAFILLMTAFAWYLGQNRRRFQKYWSTIWVYFGFTLGAFGLEMTSYIKGLRRSKPDPMDHMQPMVMVFGAFVGTMVIFYFTNQFSIPSLVAAVGATIGTRIFGLYEFSLQGSFSYVIIGLSVLIVLCLFLVSPVPTGFTEVDALFNQTIQMTQP